MSIISSIKSGLGKIGRAISGGLGEFFGVLGTLIWGVIGIIDFFGGLLGIEPTKKMHLKVVIPREINSNDIQQRVADNIELAKTILKREVNVNLLPVDGEFIRVMDYATPEANLNPDCKAGAWREDFTAVGDFFRLNSAVIFLRSQFGYGPPLTAFICRTVRGGDRGCSLGPLTGYVTVAIEGLSPPADSEGLSASELSGPSKTLAHELGHACGLDHTYGPSNLMTRSRQSPLGTYLTNLQQARFRLARQVTYL